MKAQTRRQWITTHEWMVKPMRQKEWISGKGILVWLAEVFSALGMGTYLVGLLAGISEITTWAWWATVLGWVLIVLFKLPFHLAYLGRPLRFWRAIPPFTKAWRTSWLARGMFFSIVFTGAGFLQIVFWYFLRWGDLSASASDALTVLSWIVGIVAGVFILLTGVYCGFAMSYCKSLPFWNTGLLPIVFVIMGVADGLALTMGVNLITGADEAAISDLEFWSRILLVVNALLIAGYLARAYQRHSAAELAAQDLIKGSTAWVFWVLLVILGIATPLVISVATAFMEGDTEPLLIVAIVCHTIGAFALKYSVLKVGIYRSVLPGVG
ncbi:MAG TPA: NrfD/PsrC family molybdoenzyme membrane anchor subunit [Thermoleophilia bacterium]|nr:NrfD/PsrC family molybdoenzyme membrane anchor subunit [Thermoleophilia bacterium]